MGARQPILLSTFILFHPRTCIHRLFVVAEKQTNIAAKQECTQKHGESCSTSSVSDYSVSLLPFSLFWELAFTLLQASDFDFKVKINYTVTVSRVTTAL